jgi:hypothetical protein
MSEPCGQCGSDITADNPAAQCTECSASGCSYCVLPAESVPPDDREHRLCAGCEAALDPGGGVELQWEDDAPMDEATLLTINRLIASGAIGPDVTVLDRPKLAALLGCEHGAVERRPCPNCLGAN